MSMNGNQIDAQIGSRVCKARVSAGFSVSDVSERTGMAVDHLIDIETGALRIESSEITQLANVLGIEIRALFEDCCSMQQRSVSELVALMKTNDAMVGLIERSRTEKANLRVA
ncbi:MAG: helix-turn-helix transcriptional regulator [Pseudomonadota bacterium]